MLTVILGAGASFDSKPANSVVMGDAEKWQPPLTKYLFDDHKAWCSGRDAERVGVSPILAQVIEQIRRETKNVGLEHALEKIRSERNQYSPRWSQELEIRKWLYDVLEKCGNEWDNGLKHITTYVDLLARLNLWQATSKRPINIITFNYDTLLDNAVAPYQNRPAGLKRFNDYVTDTFRVFKPHGSVNWAYSLFIDSDRESMHEDRPLSDAEKHSLNLIYVSKFFKSFYEILIDRETKYSYIPAIAIPVAKKSNEDFILPLDHYNRMINALKETTAILVIGWAAAEEHFMALLSEHLQKDILIRVVCENGGKATQEALLNLHKTTRIEDAEMGFAHFLDQRTYLEDWLTQVKS